MKLLLYPKAAIEKEWEEDRKMMEQDPACQPYCLRCGALLQPHLAYNALSRYAKAYVCPACGTDEAMRDYKQAPLHILEWDAVQDGRIADERYLEKDAVYLTPKRSFPQLLSSGHEPLETRIAHFDADSWKWSLQWGKNGISDEAEQENAEFLEALLSLPELSNPRTIGRLCLTEMGSGRDEFLLFAETHHRYVRISLRLDNEEAEMRVQFFEKS